VASTDGADLVYSYLAAYTLETNVEYGRILATTLANMAGNTLNHVIYTEFGNNSLYGSNGSDTVDYVYATTAAVAAVNLTVTTAQVTNGSGSDTLIECRKS
jgi:uncharacterized protein YfdQ (DUF2303 family)